MLNVWDLSCPNRSLHLYAYTLTLICIYSKNIIYIYIYFLLLYLFCFICHFFTIYVVHQPGFTNITNTYIVMDIVYYNCMIIEWSIFSYTIRSLETGFHLKLSSTLAAELRFPTLQKFVRRTSFHVLVWMTCGRMRKWIKSLST